MLFAGMKACFSPSVHSAYRKAWINHGGSLTHTESEFYEAHHFFCDGLDDPWLPDLASRRLIVRHPQWIAQCVHESAIMPIAVFTLDSRFQSTVIECMQSISKELIESYKTPARTDSEPASDACTRSENINSKTKSRKRPLEDDTVERARVVKRSRVFITGNTPTTPSRPGLKLTPLNTQPPLDECAKRRRNSATGHISNTVSPDQESEVEANSISSALLRTELSEHIAFWESIGSLAKPGKVLNLRIEDVLRAPEVRSTLFCRGGEYLGKPFHVNRKGSGSQRSASAGRSTCSMPLTPTRSQTRVKERLRLKPAAPWIDLRTVAKRRRPCSKRLRFEV